MLPLYWSNLLRVTHLPPTVNMAAITTQNHCHKRTILEQNMVSAVVWFSKDHSGD